MDGLFIGRFQPFHLGHLYAIRHALLQADNVWIGIGSSNRPAEKQNPFSAAERKEMITSSLDDSTLERTSIYEIPDLDNHERWAENVKIIVPRFDLVFTNDNLTGHIYSRQGITVIPIPFKNRDLLTGTEIRRKIIDDIAWEDCVPDGTRNVLLKCNASDRLKGL